jgi:hypothetical protein
MPDIGIAVIEVCLKALDDLPHDDAMAAINYITQRLHIKEKRRLAAEAQKAKLGREPTEDEIDKTLDEWQEADSDTVTPTPAGVLGLPTTRPI